MNKLNLNLQPKEYNPNLQPKGSWAETCADKPGAGMHVVISTKYLDEGGGKGVCFDVSVRAKTALEALGCTVYNPNTSDNTSGDDGWLLSFNLNLNSVADKKGFVYQLQQGEARMKSQMQQAEEMNAQWKGVPKIGAYIPDDGEYGDQFLRRDAWAAIQCARCQWAQGVSLEIAVVEPYWGLVPRGWKGTQGPTSNWQNLTRRCPNFLSPPRAHPPTPPSPGTQLAMTHTAFDD